VLRMKCKVILLREHSADSKRLVEALRYLLREAEAGRVTGLAFVALHAGPEFSTGVIGRARHSPTLTRGMVHVLEDEIRKILLP
jgi:hypothetical protein